MRRGMKKMKLGASVLVLCVALLMMGYAAFSLSAIRGDVQHLWPAPAPKQLDTQGAEGTQAIADTPVKTTNAGLRDARQAAQGVAEELEGVCEPFTLFAIAASAAVTVPDGESAVARLEALEQDAYALKPLELYVGRLIYPEEFERGERVAMMDEQLAVALFKYAEPLEREIEMEGQRFRIVGIVRDHKQVGDEQEYSLYVPYRAMEKSSLSFTALCVQASPAVGGWAAFSSAIKALGTGTTLNLSKEKVSAFLPVRLPTVVFGMTLLLAFLRFWNIRFRKVIGAYRMRLKDTYALRLLPWLMRNGMFLLLGYAAVIFVFAQLFVLLINPVYIFPEWIPAVLVEPSDIIAAFWNVWQGMAKLIELRSPELLRIQFFARILAWAAGAAAIAGGILWGRLSAGLMPQLAERETEDE